MNQITFKNNSFISSKLRAIKQNIPSDEELEKYSKYSYSEILLKLTNSNMKLNIEKNYHKYQGFFLIEKIINEYLFNIYENLVLTIDSKNNSFFKLYFSNNHIKNFLTFLKLKKVNDKSDITPYLFGLKKEKEIYKNAYSFSKTEDSINYICDKLKLDNVKVNELYKVGIFECENYLYKAYYENLISLNLMKIDETIFKNFLKKEVDFINIKSFLIVNELENNKMKLFKEIYIKGGKIELEVFEKLNSKNNLNEELLKLTNGVSDKIKISEINLIDKTRSLNKKLLVSKLIKTKHNSSFNILGLYLEIENKIQKIKRLLKMKLLDVNIKELEH
jgi:hypothetical protein